MSEKFLQQNGLMKYEWKQVAENLQIFACDTRPCEKCKLSDGTGNPGIYCPAKTVGLTTRNEVDELLETFEIQNQQSSPGRILSSID